MLDALIDYLKCKVAGEVAESLKNKVQITDELKYPFDLNDYALLSEVSATIIKSEAALREARTKLFIAMESITNIPGDIIPDDMAKEYLEEIITLLEPHVNPVLTHA